MTVYYTREADTEKALLPSQRVMFLKCKGYYDSWSPAPPSRRGTGAVPVRLLRLILKERRV